MDNQIGSEGLQDVPGFEMNARNKLFSYQILSAALAAAEHYAFLSGGRHIRDSAVEHFISVELAKALVSYKAKIWTQFSLELNDFDPAGEVHSVDHAMLEAGGNTVFGDETERKRIDIGLISDFGERYGQIGRDPHELIYAVEVKRNLADSAEDILRVCGLMDRHHESGWCCQGGGVLGFVSRENAGKKSVAELVKTQVTRFADRVSGHGSEFGKRISCCYLSRSNPLTEFENSFVAHNKNQIAMLTACFVAVEFEG
ncbi:hypothetical protein [Jiella mangrovi]|uniref:Restriction endonuclease n=1 Tax=Jiella mangrovi TaxID=2821407 RepID=A0ABS4BI42_9HYPH|nr:hypothetical protein [Jiella mangrovi]MBP0616427.1 hypothetical protein [Jiella mangrovi]